MINIEELRELDSKILVIGSHPGIIQSILDFDFLSGKKKPSIMAILASGRNSEKYFFGKKQILIPVFSEIENTPQEVSSQINLFLNVSSARRILSSTLDVFEKLPEVLGGVIFAEEVPEKHAQELFTLARSREKFIVGPASVGLLVPGVIKLGAIGGIDIRQLALSHLTNSGNVAVFSASGGMTNELIRIVTQNGKRLSFALSFGGDRFPIITPQDAIDTAEKDPATDTIIYFGELGGIDEYAIAELLKNGKITKKIICYIAGTVSDLFETPPQFGHAKAMAKTGEERAITKRNALKEVGAIVPETFTEFVETIKNLPNYTGSEKDHGKIITDVLQRKPTLFSSHVSFDENGETKILGNNMLSFAENNSFAKNTASLFLGKEISSQELEDCIDFILRLLVDHGPYTSGAVNTMITARAGKDLSAALASGLLTIGPRFGGAVNQAALNWLAGVASKKTPDMIVEEYASQKIYIAGIGHRKYRVDHPDPRVEKILAFASSLTEKKYTTFAKEIEKVTSAKKGNLILNVDGAIAAVLLDILSEKEGYTDEELENLAKNEFFNALFIASRSIGLIAHFLDQKRLDEGLFRLSEDDVLQVG